MSRVELEPRPVPPDRSGELRIRLLTSLALIPFFLFALVMGGVVFLAAILLLTGIAAWEFVNLARHKGFPASPVAGVGLALAYPLVFYRGGEAPGLALLTAGGMVAVAATQLFRAGQRQTIAAVSVTVFAALYVGVLFGHFVLLREPAPSISGAAYGTGAVLLTIPVLLTWINDSAAYAIGRRWGRHKLMPEVSPGKSVEGAIGALIVTVVMAVPVLWVAGRWVPGLEPADAVMVGLLVGVLGPCGDLIESSFKRDAGVKDVSRLIPGHGGVLDRFDSLLLTVPAFYYYVLAAVA